VRVKIKAGIIGGAGYTGGELLRLLLRHPHAEIAFVQSTSNAGKFVYEVHHDLFGETELRFLKDFSNDVDVLFLCAGHGTAREFLKENEINESIKIIDLSHDFRLKSASQIGNRTFVYGLPESQKTEIAQAKNIANPGCFATAIQLGLLPLAKAGLLKEVYTTGITGSTGAGQSLSATSHFSWRTNNIQAYKTLAHQHIAEIHESLKTLMPDGEPNVNFVPWRGDFARGIYASSIVESELSLQDANELYHKFFKNAAFTHFSEKMIDLKQVVNTNKCLIHIEKQGNKLAIHSAIDNLLKGASGQAVQNMNLMFGINETAGLLLKASGF
jgi:N-acetyl-gamma-glutamyl-phosphate reductase